MNPFVAAALLLSVMMAMGQVVFKLAAGDVKARLLESAWLVALSPWLILALSIYAATTVLWLYVLSELPLSRAYPFALIGSALVPLFSWLVFKDALSPQYFLGFCLLIVALIVIQTS